MNFSLWSVLVAAVFLFGVAAAAAVVDVEVTPRDETSDGPAAAAAIVEVTPRDETSDGPGRPPRRTLVSKKNDDRRSSRTSTTAQTVVRAGRYRLCP